MPEKLASVPRCLNMIKKVGQLQQDLIDLADPRMCRTFLPLLQSYLNELVRRISKSQLGLMSDMMILIRELMLTRKPAGVAHFHPRKRTDPPSFIKED